MNFIFPYIGNNHHPNWRTPSFFRGVGIPPTSISYCCLQASYYRTSIRSNENPDPVVTISPSQVNRIARKLSGWYHWSVAERAERRSWQNFIKSIIDDLPCCKPPISGRGIFQGVTLCHVDTGESFSRNPSPSALVIPGEYWNFDPRLHQKSDPHRPHVQIILGSIRSISILFLYFFSAWKSLQKPRATFLRRQWFGAPDLGSADIWGNSHAEESKARVRDLGRDSWNKDGTEDYQHQGCWYLPRKEHENSTKQMCFDNVNRYILPFGNRIPAFCVIFWEGMSSQSFYPDEFSKEKYDRNSLYFWCSRACSYFETSNQTLHATTPKIRNKKGDVQPKPQNNQLQNPNPKNFFNLPTVSQLRAGRSKCFSLEHRKGCRSQR